MAIGNPITLTNNVATKTISVTATADQTLFTVTGGYRINQLAVFRNGVRLADGADFTARDGSSVTLLTPANLGDNLEFQVFDDFRVADAIATAAASQTINGDLTVTGNLLGASIGIGTASTNLGFNGFSYLGAPFGATVNFAVTVAAKTAAHRYNGTGSSNGYVIDGVESPFLTLTPGRTYRFTLSSGDMTSHPFRFYLEADKTTAYTTNVTSTATYTEIVVTDSTPQVLHYQCSAHGYMGNSVQTNSNIASVATNASGLTGTPDIAIRNITGVAATFTGVVTYEDVTNIDSVGIITARSDVSIADKIVHTGDTDTAIRFPAADTFTLETGGSEALRVDSSQRLLVSTTSSASNIAGYGNGGIQLNSTTTAQANVNIIHRNNSANTHAIVLAKARDGAANGGRVQDDDDFGAISFQGFDGTGGSTYRQGAEIRGAVDGTPGNTDMPGRLEFLTTPDGSATPTERLRITSDGKVRVPDNGKFTAGAGDDLQIHHDSNNSVIDSNTGDLLIRNLGTTGDIYLDAKSGERGIKVIQDGAVELYNDNSKKLETSATGVTVTGSISDSKGELRKLIPNTQSSAYTAVASDAGKYIWASGTVTIPNNVFSAGDMVTIVNDTNSNLTITNSLAVMYMSSDGTSAASRTLSAHGMATLLFVSATVAYISGAGLS